MKKLSTLLLFFTINCIIQSCCGDEKHCFFIDSLSASHFSIQGRTGSIRQDTIEADDYAISLEASIVDDMCLKDFHLGSELYATSCPEPIYNLQDKVRAVSIISNADLSGNYLAGSELSGLFKPFKLRMECPDTSNNSSNCLFDYALFWPTSEKGVSLAEEINRKMAADMYNQSGGYQRVNYHYLLLLDTEESIIENAHSLQISFTFASGKTINLTPPPVLIF